VAGSSTSGEQGGGRSSGVGEDDAVVHGRRSWCVRSAPESMVSRRVLLGRAEELGSAGRARHGDGRSSVSQGRRLTGENGGGEQRGEMRSCNRAHSRAQRNARSPKPPPAAPAVLRNTETAETRTPAAAFVLAAVDSDHPSSSRLAY